MSKEVDVQSVRVHHHWFLPRRIYIEAPALFQLELLLELSALESLLERAVRIVGASRGFLQRYGSFKIPDANRMVRIQQPGLYNQDIGLVVDKLAGDLVTIVVVPRLNVRRKRKRGRPLAAVLEPEVLWHLTFNDAGLYEYGMRRFTRHGLEFLVAPCSHSIELDPVLSTNEKLLVFPIFFPQVDTSNFDPQGVPFAMWVKGIMRKEAAVCKGHMKGWRGPLIDVNRRTAKIECGGRHPPWVVEPLGNVVLL